MSLDFCHMKEKQMEKSKTNMTPSFEIFLHLCQAELDSDPLKRNFCTII